MVFLEVATVSSAMEPQKCIGVLLAPDVVIAYKACVVYLGQVSNTKIITVKPVFKDQWVAGAMIKYTYVDTTRNCDVGSFLILLKLPKSVVKSEVKFPIISLKEESKSGTTFFGDKLEETSLESKEVNIVDNIACREAFTKRFQGNDFREVEMICVDEIDGPILFGSPYFEGAILRGLFVRKVGKLAAYATTKRGGLTAMINDILDGMRRGGGCGRVTLSAEYVTVRN